MKTIERNHFLDLCKGITAISVVFIHTTFWSGGSYVPQYVQTLSLALEVPFFFFMSGWGIAIGGKLDFGESIFSIINIYKKYVVFITLLYLCIATAYICANMQLFLRGGGGSYNQKLFI